MLAVAIAGATLALEFGRPLGEPLEGAWGGGEGTHNIFYVSPSLLGSGGRPSLY